MALPGTTWAGAGAGAMQWSKTNNGLHITGYEGLTSANTNTASSMARHLGFVSANFQLGEAVEVDVPGDDTIQAKFIFPSDSLPSFDLEVSVFDTVFNASVTGLATQTSTVSQETRAVPISADALSATSHVLFFHRQARNPGTLAASTSSEWETLVLFNADVRPVDPTGSFTNKAFNPRKYRVICNHSSYFPDGRTMASVFPDAPNGRLVGAILRTENIPTMTAYVGNNSAVNFATVYAPASAEKTNVTIETTSFALITGTPNGEPASVDNTAPGYSITITGNVAASGKFVIAYYEQLGEFA